MTLYGPGPTALGLKWPWIQYCVVVTLLYKYANTFFLLYKYANTFTPESGYLVPQVLPFKFVQKICMKQGLYGNISVKRGSWRQIIITDKCGAKIFNGK